METLLCDFETALASHDERAKSPWTGPYHFATENERIGKLASRIDQLLYEAGLFDGRSISNAERLRRMRALA